MRSDGLRHCSWLSQLFYDLAVYGSCAACRIGLVGVNVHGQCVFGAYADDYVAEYQASAVGVYFYGYYVFVFYAKLLGILGSCVDVALCCNYAFLKLYFSCRSYQLAGAASCYVAGLTDRGRYSDGTGVCEGQLDLGLRSYGA